MRRAVILGGVCALMSCGPVVAEAPAPAPAHATPPVAPPASSPPLTVAAPQPNAPTSTITPTTAPSCQPVTCEDLGATCGSVADGCGSTLSCGTCQGSEVCTANFCAHDPAAPTKGGDLLWVRQGRYWGLDADADGNLLATLDPVRAVEYGHAGEQIASFHAPYLVWGTFFGASDREWYVWGNDRGGSTPYGRPSLHRLDATRQDSTLVALDCDRCGIGEGASDGAGAIAYIQGVSNQRGAVFARSGNPQWSFQSPSFDATAVTFDHSGNLIVAVRTIAPFTLQGTEYGKGRLGVFKFSPEGKLLWAKEFGCPARLTSIGTSALGTVVVAGNVEAYGFSFAGTAISGTPGTGFLLVLEADGQERWAKDLGRLSSGVKLAVDPVGQVALAAQRENPCEVGVMKFNLAGDALWSRTFVGSGGECQGWYDPTDIAISQHAVVVSGAFHNDLNLGDRTLHARWDLDGWMVELAP